MSPFLAACVQVNAGDDVGANLRAAREGIAEAAARGAEFIALPENVALMPAESAAAGRNAVAEEADAAVRKLAQAARKAGRWVLAGTFAVRSNDRITNRLVLFAPDGTVAARYDKIHLFDVDLPDRSYRESATFASGQQAVVASLPWLKLGLSVCYDVRFPHLYRVLAQAGAGMLAVPSAFTEVTGRSHWHVLVRARAIENACYVIAPAQCGVHPGGRRTFGHSLIVGPWGDVLAEAGDGPEVIMATIDPAQIEEIRQRLPALRHDRTFTRPG